MLEKEIKILEINSQEIQERLQKLWAEKTFEGFIHDIYYDFPDEVENKMEANGRMFRLRKKGEEHIYTIKNKRKEIKTEEGAVGKDEHETPITNIESFAKVLEKYGMKKIREKKKHRVSYRVDDMEFDIDRYEGIPELLEIEGSDGEKIQAWVEKLGLETHTQLLGGSRKLFKQYGVEYLNFDS